MMKRVFKFAATLFLVVLCAGCVVVPQTKIAWTSSKGTTASLKAPKDVELKGLKLSFVKGADGTELPVILIDEYKARTNPKVIDKVSAGQVQLLNAWKGVLSDLVNAAVAGYSGKVPAAPANGQASPQQQSQLIFVPTNLGPGGQPQSPSPQPSPPGEGAAPRPQAPQVPK